MIEIECGQKRFYIPGSEGDRTKLTEMVRVNFNGLRLRRYDFYKSHNSFLREGSFCFKDGKLKLDYPYLNEGELKDIKMPFNKGLEIISEDLNRNNGNYERYLVSEISEGKVTEFDCISLRFLGFVNFLKSKFNKVFKLS